MTDKYHSDTKEKIENITAFIGYHAGALTSGDLIPTTLTITATAEPAVADLSKEYRLGNIVWTGWDNRLEILRTAARVSLNITSMTATHLYCRVYVDVQDADHRLFDLDIIATGEKLAAEVTHSASKTTIFNLVKDNSLHTYYFFFWVDAGNAVMDNAEFWHGVGNKGTNWSEAALRLNFAGFIHYSLLTEAIGTGTPNIGLGFKNACHNYYSAAGYDLALIDGADLEMHITVNTSILYLRNFYVTLRTEK